MDNKVIINHTQTQSQSPSQTQAQTQQPSKIPLDYENRKLDTCGVCQGKFNVGDKIPRIMINCGHTYCTSCLMKYYRRNRIRCPFCKKLVKNLDNVETLPLNISLFGEIVRNDPVIMLLIDPDSDISLSSLCNSHPEKQKHFYCSHHEKSFCRECIKAFHKSNKCCVVDLYDIHKLYQLNEQNIMKNQLIVKTRDKGKGKMMKKEEFFIANS